MKPAVVTQPPAAADERGIHRADRRVRRDTQALRLGSQLPAEEAHDSTTLRICPGSGIAT